MYKYIEPEVAGGLGFETEMDSGVHPPVIKKLHYEFSGWLGDDILETFPCFIVSENLMNDIKKNQLTGVSFDDIIVTKSEEFISFYPKTNLPNFYWMKIEGKFGEDDFVIAEDYRLLISEKGMDVISYFNINNASIEDFI